MRLIIRGLAAVFLVSLTFTGKAETNACVIKDTTAIYYVNGVWNSLAQARDGRNLIKEAYTESLENQYPDQNFEFKLAYNYSAGKVEDLIEVIGQKRNEIDDPDANKLTASQYYHLYMTAKDFDDEIPSSAQSIVTVIEKYLAGRLSDTVNAAVHIQKYQTDLQQGKRVLLIAHSQGVLFANQAMASLMETYGQNIGMIGVASPAAVTYNDSTYYTAHDDRVINALRVLHDVLPSNIDNDPGLIIDPRDFSKHQFKESYFASVLPSRTKIDEDVYQYMQTLQFPTPELERGAVTVTLRWGKEPDVDLHVTEPNGTHVDHSNVQGVSGRLDRSDNDGFGPEHYVVACDTLETGRYSVGVNYYEGSEPETAWIQVSTGDGNTRSYIQPLPEATGASGDTAPVPVSTITVGQDQSGEYIYKVSR